MIYYANGCSYTWGGSLFVFNAAPKTWLPALPDTHPINKKRLETVYPHHLGQLIGASKVVNHSLGGGSNSRIVRTTLAYFNDLLIQGSDLSDHFVTIQWTAPERTEFYHDMFSSWVNVLPTGSTYEKIELNDKVDYDIYRTNSDTQNFNNFIMQVYCLGNFFKQYKIPYLFFCHTNWHTPFWHFTTKENYKKLMMQFNWLKDDPIEYTMYKSNIDKIENSHPSENGHKQWAEILHQEIKNKNLL
jgi:hypothetical protein